MYPYDTETDSNGDNRKTLTTQIPMAISGTPISI